MNNFVSIIVAFGTNRVIVAAAEVNNLYTFDGCYMTVL